MNSWSVTGQLAPGVDPGAAATAWFDLVVRELVTALHEGGAAGDEPSPPGSATWRAAAASVGLTLKGGGTSPRAVQQRLLHGDAVDLEFHEQKQLRCGAHYWNFGGVEEFGLQAYYVDDSPVEPLLPELWIRALQLMASQWRLDFAAVTWHGRGIGLEDGAHDRRRARAAASQVLRGYEWVTVVPQELTDELGGPARLRDSGAFVEVVELPPGGVFLRATETIEEYSEAKVRAVFAVLKPVLPRRHVRQFPSMQSPYMLYDELGDKDDPAAIELSGGDVSGPHGFG